MKVRSYPVVLSLAVGLLLAPLSRAAESAALPYAFVDPADPAIGEIRRLGERTLDQAGVAMLAEVRRVLPNTTPAMAIGVLHLKEYQLPAATPGKPTVTELRRTSLKVRNLANTPDAPDLAALETIRHQLEEGDPVAKVLVQKVTLPGRPPEWRVYRPLGIMKQCLECHGSAGELAPGVQDALKIFFPHDEAVDYKSSEWRGLLRVSITAPPASK